MSDDYYSRIMQGQKKREREGSIGWFPLNSMEDKNRVVSIAQLTKKHNLIERGQILRESKNHAIVNIFDDLKRYIARRSKNIRNINIRGIQGTDYS